MATLFPPMLTPPTERRCSTSSKMPGSSCPRSPPRQRSNQPDKSASACCPLHQETAGVAHSPHLLPIHLNLIMPIDLHRCAVAGDPDDPLLARIYPAPFRPSRTPFQRDRERI